MPEAIVGKQIIDASEFEIVNILKIKNAREVKRIFNRINSFKLRPPRKDLYSRFNGILDQFSIPPDLRKSITVLSMYGCSMSLKKFPIYISNLISKSWDNPIMNFRAHMDRHNGQRINDKSDLVPKMSGDLDRRIASFTRGKLEELDVDWRNIRFIGYAMDAASDTLAASVILVFRSLAEKMYTGIEPAYTEAARDLMELCLSGNIPAGTVKMTGEVICLTA